MKKILLFILCFTQISFGTSKDTPQTIKAGTTTFKLYLNKSVPYNGPSDTNSVAVDKIKRVTCPNDSNLKCLSIDGKSAILTPNKDYIYTKIASTNEVIVATKIKEDSRTYINDNDPALVACNLIPSCTGVKYTLDDPIWQNGIGKIRDGYISAVLVSGAEDLMVGQDWHSAMKVHQLILPRYLSEN